MAKEIGEAIEACEGAIVGRSLAVRAYRDGFKTEAMVHVTEAAAALLVARADIAARYSLRTVEDVIALQVDAIFRGDLAMHEKEARQN
jgi:hypothetical protein